MRKNLKLVGIGSSAGGLEALQTLFSNMKDLPNTAYIIAQHLSPTHKSMMVELLSRVSNISVQEAKNGLVIKEKTIYISPENTDIYVSDGKIFLKSIHHIFGPKPSVNYLLSSIAEEYKNNSIGIILSGTGSDGAFGIRAIKAEGGITLCQSPESSKYDGMPFGAINTGKVDQVVSIESMAKELEKTISNLGKTYEEDLNENHMQQIFKILFEETGVDFSMYKKNTITRRLTRRMHALKIDNLTKYLEYLKTTPNEVKDLYSDILIGVTTFFRDEKVFEELKILLEKICDKKEQGEEIRLWSVGCSSGEEAYTLAIILSEILKEKIDKYKIKIFATDIDEDSLKLARTGEYSETSLINVDKEIIKKYFNVKKNHYEIKKCIREMVVFSKHNIVSDSPFLRIDLITCRNMLIYFSTALQQRVFPIYHYSLNDNGILVLGKSETVADSSDLFYLIDKNLKIYKSQYTGIKEAPKLYNYGAFKAMHTNGEFSKKKKPEDNFEEIMAGSLIENVLDKCLVINSSNEVIYNKGTLPFIKLPQGKMSHNIFRLIDDKLVLDLRSAINKSSKTNKLEKVRFIKIHIVDDIYKYVRIYVIPFTPENKEEKFYLLFFEMESVNNLPFIDENIDESDVQVAKLKEELETNKIHLQNVIEELETSYEETQSLNEELQSSNEELQSSNEELETTNEELQSTNEELQTAYSELKLLYEDKDNRTTLLENLTEKLRIKTEDYRKQKEISEAIINTVPVSIIFVDENGIITFVNENAKSLFASFKISSYINKSFDNQTFRFDDLDGNNIPNGNLPFSLIKKTFEKIENFKVNISYNREVLSVNISGAPLFDYEGKFIGAVYSLEEISNIISTPNILNSKDILKNLGDIDSYSSLLTKDLNFDVMKLMFSELEINLRNNLNEINLNLANIQSDSKDKIEKLINESSLEINKISKLYNTNSFELVDFFPAIIHNLKTFEEMLKGKNIYLTFSDIDKTAKNMILNRSSQQISMILIDYISYLSKILENSRLDVEFTNIKNSVKISVKSTDLDKFNESHILSEKQKIENSIISSLSMVPFEIGFDYLEQSIEINIKL